MRDMAEKKTERSNCRFTVQQASDGKPVLVVQLFQDTNRFSCSSRLVRLEAVSIAQYQSRVQVLISLREGVHDARPDFMSRTP
jgi:hypothetical protein